MIVSIHQPGYWPWLGLLNKIARSDRFIVLDNVEANKKAYQYRNIFYCNGKEKFVTLPVNYSVHALINELEFRDDSWRQQHLNIFGNYYRGAPFFKETFAGIESLYQAEYDRPVDLLVATMRYAFDTLDIKTEILYSSELKGTGKKAAIVLDLVKKASGDVYLSGKGALDYLTEENVREFDRDGIRIVWQEFKHPIYPQDDKFDFVEGLACLDLFFFNGKEGSRKIFWDQIGE